MAGKSVISFTEEVVEYLDHLLFILYENQYFSHKSSAKIYVLGIYEFIEININTFPHKITPSELKHFGTHYLFYKPNNRTTWFIIFERVKDGYPISGILNNYCPESNFFNS